MKKLTIVSIVIAFFLISGNSIAQNIAISDVAHTADASAVLDVYSTSLGMLVPRLSSAPSTPATGLLYFDTGSSSFKYYTGSAWTELSYGSLWFGNGPDTYLSNVVGNAVIGGNINPSAHKFYVQQLGPGIISNSRIDGQLEIWNYTDYVGTGDLMLADINDFGGPVPNGTLQLYFGGTAGISLLANGNSYFNGGNVAISDASHSADPSAVLDIQSVTKGLLMPRMAIAPPTPATGLIYYNTLLNSFMYNAGTPATPNWTGFSGGGGLWSRTGTDTYLTNITDNVVIGTNTSLPGYKFYVHSPISQMSRFDGQVEFWDMAGGTMDADINDDGLGNGIMSLYDAGGTARVRLQSGGNSYLNGGFIGIGVPITIAPLTNVHLFDNYGNVMPQFFIDQPGPGNSSIGYAVPGRVYSVGISQDMVNFTANNYKICDGLIVTPPSNYTDLFTMVEIHNENVQPGIIDFNHQSRARVFQRLNPNFEPYFGYGQIIPNATWTMVNFDMLSYDEHIEWNLAPAANSGPSYFKVTEDGYYDVESRIDYVLNNYEELEIELAPIHFPNYPGYVSIAIYVSTDQGNTWNMYAQGNKLQGADNSPAGGWNDLRNNLAPNVSNVVKLNAGDWVAIFAWQDLYSIGLPLRVVEQNGASGPPAQVYCSIHKSS